VWKYGRHPISDRSDKARNKKDRRKKPHGKNMGLMSASATPAAIIKLELELE